MLISQDKQKLWISCNLSRNPPTVLCFHHSAMIQTCAYLYSSKCFLQMIQARNRSANFPSRKSISGRTLHSLLKAHSRRNYFNTYLNEISGLWMRRMREIVFQTFWSLLTCPLLENTFKDNAVYFSKSDRYDWFLYCKLFSQNTNQQ